MSRINLLYIIEGGPLLGGAEQNLLTVIKVIDKTQYKIKVCLLQSSDVWENELKGIGIPLFILNTTGKNIFSIVRLTRFIHQEKIDIAHSCLYLSNAVGRVAAILARVPIIISWEQGEIFNESSFYYNVNRAIKVDRILSRFTDCIVACSEACKEGIIKKEDIPAHKIRVIYNCVDMNRFNASTNTAAIREQLQIEPDEMLVGTVATLNNEVKGQEYLIRAMPQIIKAYPKVKLVLVGEGRSKSYFIQLINSLDITDNVILTGFRKDVPEIMNALDIYVSPSNFEALSISILEAMASKKPVVATKVGGIPEVVIDKQTGYLVPPKDTNALAKAIIDLLSNREKMQRLGEAGFERVKTYFSAEIIIKEIEALYKELSWKKHQKFQ